MYSQQELDDAVAAGVITADAANALRMHVQRQRSTAIPDEEQFRLITGGIGHNLPEEAPQAFTQAVIDADNL